MTLESQNLNQENYLSAVLPEENESVTFERGELKYFIAEIKEMLTERKIIDIPKAIHNAKYFAELEVREKEIKQGKVVEFSDEEWEKFVNAQDI